MSIILETRSNIDGELSIQPNSGQLYRRSPELKVRESLQGDVDPEYAVSQLMNSMLKTSCIVYPEDRRVPSKSKDPSRFCLTEGSSKKNTNNGILSEEGSKEGNIKIPQRKLRISSAENDIILHIPKDQPSNKHSM